MIKKRDLGELVARIRQLTKRPDQPTNRSAADWFKINNADGETAEMFIYGVIGDDWEFDDVTAGSFTRELRSITAPVIDLHINSPGGLIFDGVAIHSALKDHPAAVNVIVDGVAASAASFVAMAGDTITVQKPAKMMIHDASGLAIGNAADMLEMAALLDDLSDTIAGIYADRAGGDVAEWRDLMRATTWFSAEEAVAAGLADRIGGAAEPVDEPANQSSAPAPRGGSRMALAGAVNMITRKDHEVDIDEIMAALKAIVDGAEGRPLTDDEVKRYESFEADLANKRTEAVKARMAAYEAPAPHGHSLAAVVHVAAPKPDNGLEKAFNAYLRTGQENADIAELRNAQSAGTDTAGGFTVPEGFRLKLVERLKAFGGIAEEVEVITTDSGNRLPWPTLDDTANSGQIVAEGATPAAGADLVFGERELGAFKYMAPGAGTDPLRVSVELLQDSAFDIESLVVRKLGERIARTQAVDWVTGTGTGEPEGITAPAAGATIAGLAPTKDELIDALHSVDPDYRATAVWAFNDLMLGEIRKLDDGNGRPLWLPLESSGLESTPGGVLLGHRVRIDQAFPTPVAAAGTKWGVFGDLREGYVIRRVRDIQLVVNPYTRANQGQIEYVLWARADGAVQNPNSYSVLAEDGA